nr:MAG TPA: hypothetical protein [Caudoviricetes sp.]
MIFLIKVILNKKIFFLIEILDFCVLKMQMNHWHRMLILKMLFAFVSILIFALNLT